MAKISIYTTPTCVYCRMTKQYLSEHQFPYEEIDVSRDQAKLSEMMEKSGQIGVPVIDIDGKIIIGFDRPAINQALGL